MELLSEIGQVQVSVKDVDRATTFYRDRPGLRHLFAVPPGFAFFDCGGIRLMLSRQESASQGTSILYFRVANLQ